MEQRKMSLEEYRPDCTLGPEDYEPFIGRKAVEELQRLAEPLQGKGWVHLNSTFVGGGVAEMLRSVIPLARGLGLEARWYVIRGHDEFFQVTKKFHNLLQGVPQPISLRELFEVYLDTIHENGRDTAVVSDLCVVHDPQPAALINVGSIYGHVLWRCHIDTSAPDRMVWRFLLPYVNQYSGAVFTMPEFVAPGLQVPVYEISPCIDPRAEKNREHTAETALSVLEPLFQEHDVDPGRPILAAISRYDVHKNQATILRAFQRLREERRFDRPPYLVLLGNTATDDPEGEAMLAELRRQAGDDPDVRFWVNVENNDRVVGALMHLARGFVHVSTREGFGLVVTEALWQGTPVIGSRVGGITRQVVDGRTGYAVDPLDAEAIADRMARILERPEEAEALGRQGREHVRAHFLLPEMVRKHMMLLHFYTGAQKSPPPFRLNELSYSEIRRSLRSRRPALPEEALREAEEMERKTA